MPTDLSSAARAMASVKTPARARASRKNGKLGGRPRANYSVRTSGGRIVAAGETYDQMWRALAAWQGVADRRCRLFIWLRDKKVGPCDLSRLLAVAQKSTT